MMNLYLLFTVLLYVGGCNGRVVPLNFKPDESKQMNSRILENEFIDESPLEEVEILGNSLPDIKQSNDMEFLLSEDKNPSDLEITNGNASNLSADLESKEKDLEEEPNLESAESLDISDHPDEEFNLTSQLISKNDSNSQEPLGTLQVNGTLNDEAIDNLTVKNETFNANNSSLRDLEQGSNIESAENDEKNLNETFGHKNESFEIFEIFDGANNTDDSGQLQPMPNETEVEVFLSDTENITDNQNETFAIFDVFNDINNTDTSHQLQPFSNDTEIEISLNNTENITDPQNETSAIFLFNGTKATDSSHQLQPFSNDTEAESFLSDAENITDEFKSNNLVSENLGATNDSIKTAGGMFSGFEFLTNSEVARNAAKAMEVFNFSDPLTDHIMEENEFHSFLPAFNAEKTLGSAIQTDLKTEIFMTNSSGESNEIGADLNASSPSREETLVLNLTEALEIKNNSMSFNLSESLGERNQTELLNLTEKLEGNVTSEASPPLKNPDETTQLESETTSKNENVIGSISNSSIGVPECPPPGWCIFWFLSQDTCAVNEHCMGNRICCKISCSKTCIEVESL